MGGIKEDKAPMEPPPDLEKIFDLEGPLIQGRFLPSV